MPITVENITYKTVKVPLRIPREVTKYVNVPLKKEVVKFVPREDAKLNNDDLVSTTASSGANAPSSERKEEDQSETTSPVRLVDVQQMEIIGDDSATAQIVEEGEEEVECVCYEPEIYVVPVYIPKFVCHKLAVKEQMGSNLKLVKNLQPEFWSALILKMNLHLTNDMNMTDEEVLSGIPPPPSDDSPLPGNVTYRPLMNNNIVPSEVLNAVHVQRGTSVGPTGPMGPAANTYGVNSRLQTGGVGGSKRASTVLGGSNCGSRSNYGSRVGAPAPTSRFGGFLCPCGMGTRGGRVSTKVGTKGDDHQSSVVLSRAVTGNSNRESCCHPHEHLAHLEISPPCPCEKNNADQLDEAARSLLSRQNSSVSGTSTATSRASRAISARQTTSFWSKWQCCNTMSRGRRDSLVSVTDERMVSAFGQVDDQHSAAGACRENSRMSCDGENHNLIMTPTLSSRHSSAGGRTSASLVSSMTVRSVVTPASRSMKLCCRH